MIHLADCNSKLPDRARTASPILTQLLGVSASAELRTDERQRLEAARWLVRSVDKNCSLIDQGEDRKVVGVLLSGWAFRYQTLPNGKRQIIDFIFAGSLVGFGSGTTNSYGVEMVTACTVATMPHGQFRRLLATCPTLAMRIVECISDGEIRAHEHITSLGRRGARERIAALIVELTCRAQCTNLGKREYSFDHPVTQIMIGDALGLSNEHVCRVLGKLGGDGVIEINNHTLKVLDQAALAREAQTDARHPFNRQALARAGLSKQSRL